MGEIPHLAPRESIVIECDFCERPVLTASTTTRGGVRRGP